MSESYYEKNRDAILERNKQYYRDNVDARSLYNLMYYEENKVRLNCNMCGGVFIHFNEANHKRTLKHRRALRNQSSSN